ncbi:MAG: hypothetical protein ABIE68_04795 [bacterium]
MKNQQGNTTVAVISALVVLMLAAGGLYWNYMMITDVSSDLDTSVNELDAKITELNNKQSTLSDSVDVLATAAEEEEAMEEDDDDTDTISGIIYSNLDYNFTMTFPEDWEDYQTSTSRTDPEIISFGFEKGGSNHIFRILVYTSDQWDIEEEIAKPNTMATKITEDSSYVYAYDVWDADCEIYYGDYCDRTEEVDTIINTFELE